jgi:hypothetical protein
MCSCSGSSQRSTGSFRLVGELDTSNVAEVKVRLDDVRRLLDVAVPTGIPGVEVMDVG